MGESPIFLMPKICHLHWRCLHLSLHGGLDFGRHRQPQGKEDTSSRFFFVCWPVFLFQNLTVLNGIHQLNLFFWEWMKLYISKQKKTTQKSCNTHPQKKNMGVQAATFHSSSMLARPNKKSTPNLGLVGWCRPFIPCLQDPSLFGINRKTKTSQGMPGSVGTSLVSKGWGLKIDFSSNFLMIGSPP